jgi:signal peptidase II
MRPAIRSALLLLLLGVLTVGCDRATKEAAVAHLDGKPDIELLGGAVRVTYAENQGAFLGLGDSLPDPVRVPLLVLVNMALLIAVAWWAYARPQSAALRAAATLVIAGGIGNLIDRFAREGVVDFLVLDAGLVRTGIFNIADVALMLGAAGMLWAARTANAASPAS